MRRLAFTLPAALSALALSLSISVARADVTVAVDPAASAHPISPLIYGVNFPTDAQIDAAHLTVGRWGGNSVTRYNYENDTGNTAADYYFENIPGCFGKQPGCAPPPADPKETSGANAFLGQMKTRGMVALFTIPTIGWVAKSPTKYDHPFDCGCKQPGQDSYDQYDSPCGNGQKGGQNSDCGPATNTSVAVDPAWANKWVQYLVARLGPANGQRVYALDNEPALWSSTHRDIRKTRLGYDELWQRMRDYAVAILEADPTAKIAGPAEWGWPNYFCSDADDISKGCGPSSPDRAAHGGVELNAWLLDQAKDYEQKNGKRILHYLDLHYYPQGGQNPDRTRSLWDKTYKDPSWIDDTIALLPRMHDWVDQHYPGTQLAVSEYDFGDHQSADGAVAYAEILGIYGREGLDMATAWGAPAADETAFSAYRLYRNFDGNGGHFESVSVKTTVSGAGVEAYGAVSATRMTVALVNETGSSTAATITVGSFSPGTSALVFRGNGSAVEKQADVEVASGQVTVTLPGKSITMVVIEGKNPNMLPDAGGATTAASGPNATSGDGASSGGVGTAGGAGGAGGAASSSGGTGSTCGCRVAGDPGEGALSAIGGLAIAAAIAGGVRRRKR
ncbi:MAG: glycoside hydrolase family 44 protein [Byssovorax sp.]